MPLSSIHQPIPLKKVAQYGFLFILLILSSACRPSASSTTVSTDIAPAIETPIPTAEPVATKSSSEQPSEQTQTEQVNIPRVVQRQPTRSDIAERKPSITLTFSQEMDKESIQQSLSIDPPVAFTVETDAKEAIITIQTPLDFNTDYTFTLSKTAVNQHNVPLRTTYEWSIHLKEPLAAISHPNNDNPFVPIKLTFNYPIDEESFNQAFNIEPHIQGQLSWSEDDRKVTLTPSTKLPAETTYQISFADTLLDRDGNPIPIPLPIVFNTPPPILSHRPEGDNVNPNLPIQIRFDRLMDVNTTEAALQIEPPVNGRFQWDETTLTFIPDREQIAENTTYTITLAASATDLDGNPVNQTDTIWSYTTGEYQDSAYFGNGPNAQALDVNGRRAVHFLTLGMPTNRPSIGFELYNLSLDQFLDRYATSFRSLNDWQSFEKSHISLENSTLIKEWQIESKPSIAEARWIREVIIPDDVPPGLYVLNLVNGHINDQIFLILTNNTLMVKEAQGDLLAWVTDFDGTPIAKSPIAVYARNGELITNGQTDVQGIFHTTIPRFATDGPASADPLLIVAQNDNNFSISGLTSEWKSNRSYEDYIGGWQQRWSTPHSATYLYTDRPIYAPGQTVHYKAIIRNNDDATVTIPPENTPVTVHIRDTEENIVQTAQLTTNNFGTINGQFDIAQGAMLGNYNIEIVRDEGRHVQQFKVADSYQSDYDLIITTDAQDYLVGSEIEITVDATYPTGEPIVNTPITINRYVPNDWTGLYEGEEGNEIEIEETVTGITDNNGRFTATFNTPNGFSSDNIRSKSNLGQREWGFEAVIDDGMHQAISGLSIVNLYNRQAEITLNSNDEIYKSGEPFLVDATLLSIFNEPVANQTLTINLSRRSSQNYEYDDLIQTTTMSTDENGRARTNLIVAEPGYYQLHITGYDLEGKSITYTSYIYIYPDNIEQWNGLNREGIYIETDAESYAPGDTAQLLIETTVSGPAILVIERASIREEQLVWLEPPYTIIDLPITAAYTPNVSVSINLWQEKDTNITEYTGTSLPDSWLYTSETKINVPATDKMLNVSITPHKETYAPGEEATFTLNVTNYKGEPVSAELSFALVNEAIYALNRDRSGSIHNAFYYSRPNIVQTYDSMNPIRALIGGNTGSGGYDDSPQIPLHQNIPDTAVWLPNLHTDYNGKATVTITLPENPAHWRVTSHAITADTQVGSTYINITTQRK